MIADLFGIALPIIQAPIGSATCPALAAAVSNAGGLGTLALSWREPDAIRAMVRETRRRTAKPFAANLVLAWPMEERLEIVLEEGVRIVSTFWDDPARYIARTHAAGAVAIHTAGDADEARRAADAGVDAIVAQGVESGGHVRGTTPLAELVPEMVDAVWPVPVIAAGGIADAAGVAQAFGAGASGVWVGTRFLASVEADVHEQYKRRLLEASGDDTLLTELFDLGWPGALHRVLRNSTVAAWEAAGRPDSPDRPGEGEVIAYRASGVPVVRYEETIPKPDDSGDVEAMPLYCGSGVGAIERIERSDAIVKELATGLP